MFDAVCVAHNISRLPDEFASHAAGVAVPHDLTFASTYADGSAASAYGSVRFLWAMRQFGRVEKVQILTALLVDSVSTLQQVRIRLKRR